MHTIPLTISLTTSSVTSFNWLRLRSSVSSSNLSLRGLLDCTEGDIVTGTDFRMFHTNL